MITLFPACSDLGLETPFPSDCCDGYVFHLIVIFALVLLVISICACLFTGVAQFELLVNSLSNLASRVLIAWQ